MRDALVMSDSLEAKLRQILDRKRSRDLAAAQRAAEYEAKRRAATEGRPRMPEWAYKLRRDLEEVVIALNDRIRTYNIKLECFDVQKSDAEDIVHMEAVLFINNHEIGEKIDIHVNGNNEIEVFFVGKTSNLHNKYESAAFNKECIEAMLVELLDNAV